MCYIIILLLDLKCIFKNHIFEQGHSYVVPLVLSDSHMLNMSDLYFPLLHMCSCRVYTIYEKRFYFLSFYLYTAILNEFPKAKEPEMQSFMLLETFS